MEIEDLRTFVEVADAGGVNAAARRLGVAKSIVSRRLVRLETELGTELLARTTRGAVLTEAGLSFRDRAAGVCATIDAAQEEMSPGGDIRGLLRIAGPASIGTYFAPALAELARRHPSLQMHTRFSDQYVDLAAEGFDCGIRVGYLPDSNLIARKIGALPVRLYASPGYIEAKGAPEHPDEVAKHATVIAGTNPWVFSDGNRTITVHPQGRFRADNAYVLAEAAAAGIGIVAMGEMIADPYVNAGRLVRLMTRYTLPDVGIFVVWSPSQHVPRKVRVLVDLLLETFSARFPAGLDASEADPKTEANA